MTELLNTIRAEIERRKIAYRSSDNLQDAIRYDEITDLLAFLDTLEEKSENPINQEPELPKIKGWVARDSVEDAFNGCGLILHHSKPWRIGGEWSSQTIAMHLPWSMFPDLCWQDEPIEVELTIKKV